ncbi:DUF427 domain-containing protein [Micromonospora sp. NPDC049679]|uniref:DUF427 domain-containing protein n=1 Tax=Micromonospora sp. NPDC049679 TaxID=3155920 RepID=UPI0033E50B6C
MSQEQEPPGRGLFRVESSPKRVRAFLGGDVVADSTRPLLVWEVPYYPTYYFPAEDVRARLTATGATEQSHERGVAEVLDVATQHGAAAGAGRRFRTSPIEELRSAVRLEWGAMDEWMEEDEPVYTHPHNPYSRIDILASSRHIRVELEGVTLADSRTPRILFETGLPPRFYLPLPHVRMDLLRPSRRQSHCAYKGTAAYWSVDVYDRSYDDLAWIYRTPLPECQKIAGLVCFYNERVDILVDSEVQERPQTQFS